MNLSPDELALQHHSSILSLAVWLDELNTRGRKIDPANPQAAMLASEVREFQRRGAKIRALEAAMPETDSPQSAEARLLSLDLENLT